MRGVTRGQVSGEQMAYLGSIGLYALAALFEIAGCFAFWAWLRLGKSALWAGGGVLALILFAVILTRVEGDMAGRAYAAYGGIYIVASLVWLWLVEGQVPTRWDMTGAALCFAGMGVILIGALQR